jgi:hypothetical protein
MAVTDSWIDQELAGCQFKDMRLGKRFRKLLEQLSDGTGESIPLACQDWANTKAAYRFLANERVKEDTILAGHFQSTRDRFAETDTDSPILILHDTTEFTYSRTDVEPIGILHKSFTGKMKRGRLHHFTVCGILMHSSLAVTTEGLPLGLTAIKFWTRSKFKGTNALKRKINPTRVPIEEKESFRWLENLKRTPALCAYRRSGERYLRAVLRRAGSRNSLSGANLCGSARRRWESDHLRRDEASIRQGAASYQTQRPERRVVRSRAGTQMEAHSGASAHWQKQAISRTDVDRNLRPRTNVAQRAGAN